MSLNYKGVLKIKRIIPKLKYHPPQETNSDRKMGQVQIVHKGNEWKIFNVLIIKKLKLMLIKTMKYY